MSTTLSMTSRQFAPSTRIESQVQSVHSADPAPSINGIVTSSGGGLPSGSFQTNSWPFRSRVRQARVLAATGTRRAYGIAAHRPSPPQRQSWNGQAMASPLTVPWLRSPPMCRQYASSTCSAPEESANTTSLVPNAAHRVRAAVTEPGREPQAVPAAREPGRRRARLDGPNLIHTPRLEHVLVYGIWQCPIRRARSCRAASQQAE